MGFTWRLRRNARTTSSVIFDLQQQLKLLEVKEERTQKEIEEELKKVEAAAEDHNATTPALQRKKAYEQELDALTKSRLQLEMTIHSLEQANLNAETMRVMMQAVEALKAIHDELTPDKVEDAVASYIESRAVVHERLQANPEKNVMADLDSNNTIYRNSGSFYRHAVGKSTQP